MTLQEMIPLAQSEIKMTHEYFAPYEWLIMKGNTIQFEDGVRISLAEWTQGKDYLNDNWEKFEP